jgi:hypothetical protein
MSIRSSEAKFVNPLVYIEGNEAMQKATLPNVKREIKVIKNIHNLKTDVRIVFEGSSLRMLIGPAS